MMLAYRVLLGSVDISFAVTNASIRQQLTERPNARITIDLSRAPSSVIDLAADVHIFHAVTDEPAFTGEVISATRSGQIIELVATTGLELSDGAVSDTINIGMPALELVRTLLVQAGLTQDRMRLEGLETPQREYFEVVTPVVGLKATARSYLAGVAFLPGDVVRASPWLARPDIQSELRDAFTSFDTYVCAGVTASWVTDAEEKGRARALDALALLTVDSRCGLASGPNGHRLQYFRRNTRVVPMLSDWCMVRSVTAGRGWIRNTATRSLLGPIELSFVPTFASLFANPLPDDLRLAAGNVYQATVEESTLARNLSLWNAVEFYAGTVRPAKIFARAEARRLLKTVLKQGPWSEDQRQRLRHARENLNERPLLWRLRYRLVTDGVPFTEDEFTNLATLRQNRNDTVHGRHSNGPLDAAMRSGIALMSRAIIYSAARASAPP